MKEYRLKEIASGHNNPLFMVFEDKVMTVATYDEDKALLMARLRKSQRGEEVKVTIQRSMSQYVEHEIIEEEVEEERREEWTAF